MDDHGEDDLWNLKSALNTKINPKTREVLEFSVGRKLTEEEWDAWQRTDTSTKDL